MAFVGNEGFADDNNKSSMNFSNSNMLADNSPTTNEEQGSVTASPSVGSISSSLLAQLKLDDEFFMESKDLMVRVDNPEKHSSAIESYITFRVLTKTTRGDFDNHEYSVRRRYNDFVWLRQKLEDTYPTHLVPPLPEKHSIQRLNRFNADFIKTRMAALNKFLMRVTDHPVLSFDKNFQLFLVSKPFEFAAHKKESIGILGRVTNTFHNFATAYMMKSRAPEFDHMNEYINKFEEKMGTTERIGQRINREHLDYTSELREFHPIFTLWASSENQLGRGLTAFATAIEKCASAQQAVVDEFESEFGQPLREYILYADSIKNALKRRDGLQIEYELTIEELNSRKLEKEHAKVENHQYSIGSWLGKSPDDIRKNKELKIDQLIESLTQQAEHNNDKAECANANLRADMERWQSTKHDDLKAMFVSMASRQTAFYRKCIAAWEEAIPLIRDTDLEYDLTLNEKVTTN